ncbi:hypothetical protein FOZ63_029948 [Perkinsus olseni]|uniref:PPM-type phosphatase domain-containing protein n=2 Tax=Perkinsus olseni TaxID=32597 RepID=A0A7J6SYG4_PEROL|nr:hypothetical protein FOZ63_029948 [Perkinsus olseni]
MGCGPSTASSSSSSTTILRKIRRPSLTSSDAARRRRLSITEPGAAGEDKKPSKIRSFLSSRSSSSSCSRGVEAVGVDDIVATGMSKGSHSLDDAARGRRWSIASTTDSDLHHRETYKDKDTLLLGGVPERTLRDSGIGYACKKGLKPDSPNQDSFLIMNVDDSFTVYGVFDGHGLRGHDVSNFVKESLVKLILNESKDAISEERGLDRALRAWFPAVQQRLEAATKSGEVDAACSGSTATLCVHCHKTDTVTAAWVGDSRAVLALPSSPKGVEMTTDHRPDKPEEKARIEKSGGRVGFDGHCSYRVYVKGQSYPGLNMSRAMGDLIAYYRAGVVPIPDTRRKAVLRSPVRETSTSSGCSTNSNWRPGDPFLLVCSDGVWEFISTQEAVGIVSTILTSSRQAQTAADVLAKRACRRWLDQGGGVVIDDITVIVSCLVPHPPST